jgi:hypothetical protein
MRAGGSVGVASSSKSEGVRRNPYLNLAADSLQIARTVKDGSIRDCDALVFGCGVTRRRDREIAQLVARCVFSYGHAAHLELASPIVLWLIQMIHRTTFTSCPDLFRASTKAGMAVPLSVDGRDKPGHDDQVNHLFASGRLAMPGTNDAI